ncbi:hypothetical protein LguiA_009717 [Lonicera macranthoides]
MQNKNSVTKTIPNMAMPLPCIHLPPLPSFFSPFSTMLSLSTFSSPIKGATSSLVPQLPLISSSSSSQQCEPIELISLNSSTQSKPPLRISSLSSFKSPNSLLPFSVPLLIASHLSLTVSKTNSLFLAFQKYPSGGDLLFCGEGIITSLGD